MVCPKCGATNESSAAFCFNCGTRLEPPPAPIGSPTVIIRPDDSAGSPTIRMPPADSAGSPTILMPPDERPPQFGVPPAPTLSPPPTPRSTQQLEIPASSPPPFGVPASPPATPYSTQQFGTPPVVPNSTAAIISLVFGIVSYFALPFIGAIVAIVAGHMARGEIRRSNGAVGGRGMATAGLVLGYAHIVLVVLLTCLAFFIAFGIGLSTSQ